MRVLQLIDSLNPGGAERMAVTLTNSLMGKIEFSGICVSRKEGILKEKINPEAPFLFLGKKWSLDLRAIIKLYYYIRVNKIDVLHAHGSSYFLGALLKILNPHLRLIWHDHYGKRATENISSYPVLKMASYFFSAIIVVNKDLLKWSKANLKCRNVKFLPNFISFEHSILRENSVGQNLHIDLIYLANLKNPKNHLNLLAAFKLILKSRPFCVLYLIGKIYSDNYSKEIMKFIKENNIQNQVILTGEVNNVFRYLRDSKIGIISSNSEGLPMALLEYGLAGLAVVSTDVGACREVIGENGKIVEINNPIALANKINCYLDNEAERIKDAKELKKTIKENFSDIKVIPEIIQFYSL